MRWWGRVEPLLGGSWDMMIKTLRSLPQFLASERIRRGKIWGGVFWNWVCFGLGLRGLQGHDGGAGFPRVIQVTGHRPSPCAMPFGVTRPPWLQMLESLLVTWSLLYPNPATCSLLHDPLQSSPRTPDACFPPLTGKVLSMVLALPSPEKCSCNSCSHSCLWLEKTSFFNRETICIFKFNLHIIPGSSSCAQITCY